MAGMKADVQRAQELQAEGEIGLGSHLFNLGEQCL